MLKCCRVLLLKRLSPDRTAAFPDCNRRLSCLCLSMCLTLIMGFLLAFGPAIVRANSAGDTDDDTIIALIKQLGSKTFSKREAARLKLEAIGAQAHKDLRKAAESTDDDTAPHFNHGLALMHQRKYKKAANAIRPPVEFNRRAMVRLVGTF